MKIQTSNEKIILTDVEFVNKYPYKEYERNPSTVHRVYYVGATRAKKHLHIMQPQTERYYDL